MQEYGGALESLLQVLGVNWVDKLPGHSLAPRIAAQKERAVLGWVGQVDKVDKLPGHSLAPRIAAQKERAVLGWVGQGKAGLGEGSS